MPVMIVDRFGNALPANAIVFGKGYTVGDLGYGIARLAASGDVTRESSIEHPVTRWAQTVTRLVTFEATSERTVTRFITRQKEATRDRYASEVTVTRDAAVVSIDRYGLTVTRDVSVTDTMTHDKYAATVTLPLTATREITVTRRHAVTRYQ